MSKITINPFNVVLGRDDQYTDDKLQLKLDREHQDFNVNGNAEDIKMDMAWRTDWPNPKGDQQGVGFHCWLPQKNRFADNLKETTAIWELEVVPKWSGTVQIDGKDFTLETTEYKDSLTKKVTDPRNYKWENTMSLDVDADEKPKKLSLFPGSADEESDNDGWTSISFDAVCLLAALLLRECENLLQIPYLSRWRKVVIPFILVVRTLIPSINIIRHLCCSPKSPKSHFKFERTGYVILYAAVLLVTFSDVAHYGFVTLGGKELVKEFLIGFYDEPLEVSSSAVSSMSTQSTDIQLAASNYGASGSSNR